METDMFCQDNCMEASQSFDAIVSQSYKATVQDLIHDEQHYIRDLHMIIKIFREEIAKLAQDENNLEMIFSNIIDIYEITVTLLGSLEDIMEFEEEKQTPAVGSCFKELAEAAEFDVYIKYAKDINSPANREVLMNLLSRPEADVNLRVAGYNLQEVVKYYLPKLLLQPIRHFFLYFNYIQVLHKCTPSIEDRKILEQVKNLLKPLELELRQHKASLSIKDTGLPMQSRARRQVTLKKISELQKTVDGWDQLDIGQCCSELIREDTLEKVNGRKLTKRKAILFDGLLVLCKPSNKKINVVTANNAATEDRYLSHREFRLKERFFIRKINIIDKEDTKELKNAFEIASKDHPNVLLVAESVEDKNNWMADLVMLNTKSMLERTLDSILLDEERKHPLRLPPTHLYKFAEQDGKENIVLESRENGGVPLIKSATLIKLIERLTYHTYIDPVFVRTFLTTYRSFCSPQELLTLLIERFDIPDPSTVYGEEEKLCWERYKREFCQPVQLRVLNVLRHWVNHHFYDFERDKNLLERLQLFLSSSRSMRKWVDSLLKIVQRKYESSEQRPITHIFEQSFPPIETHLTIPENNEEYGILTIHPTEFARQLTLLEFDMFRVIKPSELIGCVWTKEDKERTSPNLMKMIKHTTNFTRWLEKIIVEAQNFEERIAIVSRAIEIMMVLEDLNNFNGVLAIVSAMDSASIHRLKFTFESLQYRFIRALEDARELNNDHFRKYQEKLRFINPPCVPFLGMYLTNILHIEEGNPDYLPRNSELINFSKLQKVAEIIGTIQQYQNQPYCLLVESKIRQYIENICPFDSNMSDDIIDTYLYNRSLEIEPRGIEEAIEFCEFIVVRTP